MTYGVSGASQLMLDPKQKTRKQDIVMGSAFRERSMQRRLHREESGLRKVDRAKDGDEHFLWDQKLKKLPEVVVFSIS